MSAPFSSRIPTPKWSSVPTRTPDETGGSLLRFLAGTPKASPLPINDSSPSSVQSRSSSVMSSFHRRSIAKSIPEELDLQSQDRTDDDGDEDYDEPDNMPDSSSINEEDQPVDNLSPREKTRTRRSANVSSDFIETYGQSSIWDMPQSLHSASFNLMSVQSRASHLLPSSSRLGGPEDYGWLPASGRKSRASRSASRGPNASDDEDEPTEAEKLLPPSPGGKDVEKGLDEAEIAVPRASETPYDRKQQIIKSLLFGAINSIILIPVMISFANIIFRDKFFEPYLPILVKLVLFSSIVHQVMFSLISSLPFAVGQVQDAGLIFLSSMATTIVSKTKGADPDAVLATVLCWLALSTAMLGVALYITGRLKLASLVQYLPMPVVGGYLAFIGFYCLEAGLALMSGEPVSGITDWKHLGNKDALILMAPGIAVGLALYLITARFKHYAVLPLCLIIIPCIFHVALAASPYSLDDARNAYGSGWVGQNTGAAQFYHIWDHFKFSKIHWHAIPSVIPTWIAMYLVVSFSSSLDVAAVQMELGKPLDFDHELKTVGISNIASGLTGGFTGSYIFSQTIFTMRAGIRTKLCGAIIIICCLVFLGLPFSLLAYLPKLFFGGILVFIAAELMIDWLIHSYKLVPLFEYIIIWLTFIAINALNLEFGMLIGIGIAALAFVIMYARARTIKYISATSNTIRSFKQRRLLASQKRRIVALELRGFLFFGSSLRVLNHVKHSVIVSAISPNKTGELGNGVELSDKSSKTLTDEPNDEEQYSHLQRLDARPGERLLESEAMTVLPTDFLVLDFHAVTGLDATAVRTCFVALQQQLALHGIVLVFTGLSPAMQRLMQAHAVLPPPEAVDEDLDQDQLLVQHFPTLDEGLEWSEDELLSRCEAARDRKLSYIQPGLKGLLQTYLDPESKGSWNPDFDMQTMNQFFQQKHYEANAIIFRKGDPAEHIYFIRTGEVAMYSEISENDPLKRKTNKRRKRMLRYTDGGIIGVMDFFTGAVCNLTATCYSPCEFFILSHRAFHRMYREEPRCAAALQTAMLKSCAVLLNNNFSTLVTT
eukprot:m.152094 g.152094  ORF g.152094 m.152094 type:complete len:1056 (+) comp24534_c0_seq1:22-3189(+)